MFLFRKYTKLNVSLIGVHKSKITMRERGNLSSPSTKLKQKLRFASNKTMPGSVSSNQRRVVDEIQKRSLQQLHNLKSQPTTTNKIRNLITQDIIIMTKLTATGPSILSKGTLGNTTEPSETAYTSMSEQSSPRR